MNLSNNVFPRLPDEPTLHDYIVILHIAICNCNRDMLKHFLIVSNPPVYFMSTLLEYAIFCGYLEGVQLLVDHGADVNYINHLHQATVMGHLPIVKYLVSQGANISANNYSAERLAQNNNYVEIVEYLRQARAQQTYQPVLNELIVQPPRGNFPGGMEYQNAKHRFTLLTLNIRSGSGSGPGSGSGSGSGERL
jgi:ankyrin repeat protein